MKLNKKLILFLFFFTAILIAITVTSQVYQTEENIDKFTQTNSAKITDTITLEEKQDCQITFYNQTEPVYGYVPRERIKYGICFDPINQTDYKCENGTEDYQSFEVIANLDVLKNRTDCTSRKSFFVSINKGNTKSKKEIDFSSWGVCVNETENGCLAIICGTQRGGSAVNGIFNGCDGGKSCQKFLFCGDSIKILQKASRDDYVEYDPTYHLTPLYVKEMG